jgi:hypothetical protein
LHPPGSSEPELCLRCRPSRRIVEHSTAVGWWLQLWDVAPQLTLLLLLRLQAGV